MRKKLILIILDGWGLATNQEVSAIAKANTPFIDSLYKKYPHCKLTASGIDVGLPKGQMGNSEVGHMNLGAGRIVYQDLVKINQAIEKKELQHNKILIDALEYAKKENKKLHLIGLVSDGGIHAHINHLKALLSIAKQKQLEQVYLHAFTDGRDCDPKSGIHFVEEIEATYATNYRKNSLLNWKVLRHG